MPHVSKKKLDHEVLEILLNQLYGVFKIAGNKKSLAVFTEDLFTKTEKTMFAKRLAAILLLNKGTPQHVISNKLNMSPSTIARLSFGIDTGQYNGIIMVTKNKSEEIIDVLLETILENLPRPFGRKRNRYQSMYRDSTKFT